VTDEFRPGQLDDAPAMLAILESSLEAEEAKGGIRHLFSDQEREIARLRYLVEDPAGASWVAEGNGEPVGFGIAARRGAISWLAYLFVAPVHQGRGLGRELLARLWPLGAEARATLVDVSSRVAFRLYLGLGLTPRTSVLSFEGRLPAAGDVSGSVLTVSGAGQPDLRTEGLNRQVFGAARTEDQLAWTRMGLTYRSLYDASGEWLGYARWTAAGRLGPVALERPNLWPEALKAILGEMSASAIDSIRLLVPGENASAVRWLVGHGLEFQGMEVALSTTPVGDWRRCLIHRAALP
jgi:GNAT superfamily N-acetyltransferase